MIILVFDKSHWSSDESRSININDILENNKFTLIISGRFNDYIERVKDYDSDQYMVIAIHTTDRLHAHAKKMAELDGNYDSNDESDDESDSDESDSTIEINGVKYTKYYPPVYDCCSDCG